MFVRDKSFICGPPCWAGTRSQTPSPASGTQQTTEHLGPVPSWSPHCHSWHFELKYFYSHLQSRWHWDRALKITSTPQPELSSVADKNAKWCRHFENNLGVSDEVKQTHTIPPSILLLDIYPGEIKHIRIMTSMWMFIADLYKAALNWKQFKCPSIEEWINNLWHTLPTEYYSKKEWTMDIYSNMEESQNHYAQWKKSDTKESILYDSIYTKFSEM